MNAEIIAVGSELLLGQITNTNAKFLSTQLSELGINVYFHTVVGDNATRLKQAIELAEQRADLIILTGGLGPTKDDLTKHTVAAHLDESLIFDKASLEGIEQYFRHIGREMTENNRQQALVLKNAQILANNYGMAPGMLYKKKKHVYVLLPGPPREMQPMFVEQLKPILEKALYENAKIVSHVLRFYGIGEAELETKVADLLEQQSNPTIAPLASDGEVMIRITARASSEHEATHLITAVRAEIESRVGPFIYGYDNDSLHSRVIELCQLKGYTIASAESLTGGLFASELISSMNGASKVVAGSIVAYTAQAKIEQLGVEQSLIEQFGVVSSECAARMAVRSREIFHTSFGVSFTGIAGPYAEGDIAAGTIWVGFALPNGEVRTKLLQLKGDRNMNRIRTVKFALSYLIKYLKEQ